MSELGDLADVIFGMVYLLLLLGLWLVTSVIVCGCAVLIRRAHVHKTCMFARAAENESRQLFATLQSNVDRDIQNSGFLPGTNGNGNRNAGDGNGRRSTWLMSLTSLRTVSEYWCDE